MATGATVGNADRLRRELDRWRRLFVLGEIEEANRLWETRPLEPARHPKETLSEVLDVERTAYDLRNVGKVSEQGNGPPSGGL